MKQKILTATLVVVFLISAYQSYKIKSEYRTAADIYEHTAEQYLVIPQNDSSTENTTQAKSPIEVDFEGLQKMNPDIIGWLYCEDTPINYPILQGDSNKAYLHTMPDGTEHKSGSIFVDYRCEQPFDEEITLIYGHHMKDGSMFGSLKEYQEQYYYEKHPVMWLMTPEDTYEVQLAAAYVTDTDDEIFDIDGVAYDWQAMLTRASEQSAFTSNVQLKDENPVIVLSTCAYETDNARFVVWGVIFK